MAACSGPVWDRLSSVSHGWEMGYEALAIPTELLATHRFWRRGSHCLLLCAHWWTHHDAMDSPNPWSQRWPRLKSVSHNTKQKDRDVRTGSRCKREIKVGRVTLEFSLYIYIHVSNCQRKHFIKVAKRTVEDKTLTGFRCSRGPSDTSSLMSTSNIIRDLLGNFDKQEMQPSSC